MTELELNLKKGDIQLSDIVDYLYAESERVAAIPGDDIYKYCEIGYLRSTIWDQLGKIGLPFVKLLEQELKKPKTRKRFSNFELSMRDYILEDTGTAPFHVYGQDSIDELIKSSSVQKLDHEAAGRLCQYQNIKSLIYLFQKYGERSDLTPFLQLVYGECIFRNTKVLEDQAVSEFYSKHVKFYWESTLPPKPFEFELEVPLFNFARTEGMSSDNYGFEEIKGNEFILKAPNINDEVLIDLVSPHDIEASFSEWKERSNGEVVTRHFSFKDQENQEAAICAVISTEKELASNYVEKQVKQISAATAYSVFFNAASGGGCAYCQWGNSLRARFSAWKSFSGMMSLDWRKGSDIVLDEITNCDWYFLDTKSEWFIQIMDDVWMVCINKRMDTISMIAATDTD